MSARKIFGAAGTFLLGVAIVALAVWLLGELVAFWCAGMLACWLSGYGVVRAFRWFNNNWRKAWDEFPAP